MIVESTKDDAATRTGFFTKVRALLASRKMAWVSAGAGVLLSATAFGRYWAYDDFVLGLIARGEPRIPGLDQKSFDLFTFTSGKPADNHALMDGGIMLPWWTDETLKVCFYRPLSSLTHRLDFAVSSAAEFAYAHSFVWFALTIVMVAHLYRRFETSAVVAGTAAFLYGIDDAHGAVIAWISNRNALIATVFGILVLLAHDRARREGHGWSRVLAPLYLLAGLLSGEFAIAALAYLVAYALFLDDDTPRARALSLTPYVALIAAWRMVYRAAGISVHGSGSYIDPIGDAGRFLRVLPERIAVLLEGLLGLFPSDFLSLGKPRDKVALIVVGCITIALAVYAWFPFFKKDRLARFWGAGMVASLVPVAASTPSDRVFLFSGIGAMALIARMFAFAAERLRTRRYFSFRLLVCVAFALVHTGLAVSLLPIRAAQAQATCGAIEAASNSLSEAPNLAERTVVIVNPPAVFFANYIEPERAFHGSTRPAHFYPLAGASSTMHVERVGPRELTILLDDGFLYTPLEQHFRGTITSLPPGSRVELAEMSAEVLTAMPDGRPQKVRFSFREPLESERYLFLGWDDDRYGPFKLPAVGESSTLPVQDLAAIFWRGVRRIATPGN